MSGMELPLVVFTVVSQLAIGLALISLARQWVAVEGPPAKPRVEWFATAAIAALAILASFTHLGHPTGAIRAITHPQTAWLSREALGAGVFLGLAVVTALTTRKKLNLPLATAAVAVGLLTLFSTGMTYAPPSYPALNNALPLVFFLLTACILGSGFATYFTPAEHKPLLTKVLAVSLITALVVYLTVPCVWLSGGTVMAMTGKAWIGSGLFWLRVVGGLALPLAVVAWTRTAPLWLPPLLLAGELLGRVVFFSQTVHTAINLGGMY